MDLDPIFQAAGYSLWPHAFSSILKSPGLAFPLPSGFGYAVSTRSQMAPDSIGSVGRLRRFEYGVHDILSLSILQFTNTDFINN